MTAAQMPLDRAPIYPGPRPVLEKLWPARISPVKHLDPGVIPDCTRDPEKWFPERPTDSEAFTARSACAQCPLRQGCARVALDDIDRTYGIWAGIYIGRKGTTHGQASRRAAIAALRVIAEDVPGA